MPKMTNQALLPFMAIKNEMLKVARIYGCRFWQFFFEMSFSTGLISAWIKLSKNQISNVFTFLFQKDFLLDCFKLQIHCVNKNESRNFKIYWKPTQNSGRR